MQYFEEQKQKANLGDSKAMFIVGLCYTTGAGVIHDEMQAMAWTLKARDSGYEGFSKSMNIDEFYIKKEGAWLNVSEAIEWYEAKVDSGDPSVQYNLGLCYYKIYKSAHNMQRAFYYFGLAANQNHSGAQYCIGVCYGEGLGVSQDKYQAVKWFKLAAENGHEGAKHNLRYLQQEGYYTNT